MSQKELLYIEDESLADYLLNEAKKHEMMEKKLLKELEGAINE